MVRGNNSGRQHVLLKPLDTELKMLCNRLIYLVLLIGLLFGAAACDNVGRAFDPNVDPSDPSADLGISNVQVVPVGGNVSSGRPLVRETYPEGSGWPSTVPIVVEFSESLNQESILPTSPAGLDARIGVRAQGTQQLLPAQYDFLAQGRLLIIRPINGLLDQGGVIYEVVMFPEGRDSDGLRFQVIGGEKILSEFQVNQDTSIADGSILAVFPRDNYSEQEREGDVILVFDRPANASSLTPTNIVLQPSGSAPILVDIETPVSTVGIDDPRVVLLDTGVALEASQTHEIIVTEDITFGVDGNLDFNGATPFSRFTTIGPSEPVAIELGNSAVGFPNQINRQNALSVMMNIDTPGSTLVGDTVVARIYGGNASTNETFDIDFVERTAVVAAAGAQTVMVDFGAQLGTLEQPVLDEGAVIFCAQILRGNQSTGFIRGISVDEPRFDITAPTLLQAGPPSNGTDLIIDTESVAYYGLASEPLAEASFADGFSPNAPLFGSDNSGRFLIEPVVLGRLPFARDYTVTLTDLVGNISSTAIAGSIRQRGQITGVLAGMLTVEAFDQATLEPIVGATVLVDPANPTNPASGQLIGTTGLDGRVSFTSGLSPEHTITIIRSEYDLVTLYGTRAAHVSLPLAPLTDATATLRGTTILAPTPGATVLTSSSAFSEHQVLGVRSTSAAASEIPATPIWPNRPQILTAFGGEFEATVKPTYAFQACQVCGVDLVTPTAPPAPAEPGGEVAPTLILSPAITPLASLVSPHSEDFLSAVGLDTGNIEPGYPRARVVSSLIGFEGQVLIGVGTVTSTGPTVYEVDANYSLPIVTGLACFTPVTWLVTEAADITGRISRSRVFLDPLVGTKLPGPGPIAIPVITPPSAPFTGSPSLTVSDGLDAASINLGLAVLDITATDSVGRSWHLIAADRDGTGRLKSFQFPDLVTPNVAGLTPGVWTLAAEGRLILSFTESTPDDFVLTERFRQEVYYSRSENVTFTVN